MSRNSRSPIIQRSDQSLGSQSDNYWAERFEAQLKSAVHPKKDDQNLFDQINAIMNNVRPRYSSVQEAVEKMQERSGFKAHLQAINKENSAIQNKTAKYNPETDNSFFDRGKNDGEYDAERDQAGDILASILAQKSSLPEKGWIDYAKGYAVGSGMDDLIFEGEKQRVLSFLARRNLDGKEVSKVASEKEKKKKPVVIEKCPQILTTLENHIRDSKGHLSVPAIIEKVKGIHRHDVNSLSDWDDPELLRLVSQLNLSMKAQNPGMFQNHLHLGKEDRSMDRTDQDPSNSDFFAGLNPAKV